MRSVGIKTLKNKLSEYIRAAAAGETILVTDRNRVVAEIKPPRRTISPVDESNLPLKERAWFKALVSSGVITPAADRKAPIPSVKPIMTFDELMKELDEDRADRI